MSQPTELKPCPFCGGEATTNERHKDLQGKYYLVGCRDCNLDMFTPEDWNTRHLDTIQPPDAALVEALEFYAEQESYVISCGDIPIIFDGGIKAREALAQHREGKQWSDDGPVSYEYIESPSLDFEAVTDTISRAIWLFHKGQWYGPITPPGGK